MAKKTYPPIPAGHVLVCRKSRTLPSGQVIYASAYGKKAFCWIEKLVEP
jgi:hypothetical protein